MTITQNKSIGSKAYNDNFDAIFGTKEERAERRAKEKEEIAEKQKAFKQAASAAIHGANFEPFKSPVDGSVISNPQQLREHNSRNGVADIREYGNEWFEQRGREMHNEKIGNTEQAKRERQQLCHDVLRHHKVIR